MLFAYSGNDILLSEKDYVSLFVDGNLEDAPSTSESLNAHPKKRFQFTPVEGSSNPPPTAVGESDSVRIFRLVKINPDGNGHSEKLVYCQEYSEAISEPIITAGTGAAMQESYRQEDAVSLNNIFNSVSAQPSEGMSEQAQFDLTWMNFDTSIAPELGLDLTKMDLDTSFAPEVEMGWNTDFDANQQQQPQERTTPGSLSSFASVSPPALETTLDSMQTSIPSHGKSPLQTS
ncbi:hypothetical protein GGU10DRAFT_437957 [Lentinula aff. detonsa]|uniref:Uncharacterized protein n=1 Tax=Lentinula aff. detonsa TaxID=2804958 RepID=A0AA38K7K0_9AGAR|nr:hypothetical protein GGU10DRAFT_437957 [Lentinula aff. detonsa]